MKAFTLFIVLAAATCLVACTTVPTRMNKLEMGMTKAQAEDVMGTPDAVYAHRDGYLLSYTHKPFGSWFPDAYFVKVVDDKVVSFGKVEPDQDDLDRRRAAAAFMLGRSMTPIQPYQNTTYQMPVNKPINCTTNNIGTTAYTSCN